MQLKTAFTKAEKSGFWTIDMELSGSSGEVALQDGQTHVATLFSLENAHF